VLRYFDANCCLGRFNAWDGSQPETAGELLPTMDHYGIAEALVVASLAREQHPADGNQQILQAVTGQARLRPAWVGLPPCTGELPPPGDMLAEMEERGVRALFLYPRYYQFGLDDPSTAALLAPFARRRVPVFISPNGLVGDGASDQTDWPGLTRVCRDFPDLPVVISENRISYSQRRLFQALDACPNLHLDVSTVWIGRMVEFIAERWGAERLLFGSALPVRDPALAIGQVAYAGLTPTALEAIAGGNLRRLLAWAGRSAAPEVAWPEPIDALHALTRDVGDLTGQGFRCGHGHLGPYYASYVAGNTPERVIEEMDRAGVTQAVVFANIGMNGDERYGNDLVAAAARRHVGRFAGLTIVNLQRSDAEIAREMERGWQMGLHGIKLHPHLQGVDTNSAKVELACAFAARNHTVVINHDWGSSERILSLCRKYPDATLITGHTSSEGIKATREVENLYIGSCPLLSYGFTERLVEQVGAERIVFGSDLTWMPIGWGLGPILYAHIPESAKRLILGGNLSRILSRCGLE
jgi:predicted TIM-barrel fold metal-dependent hydrolase